MRRDPNYLWVWEDAKPACELNNGNSRIVIDDGCYVLLNRAANDEWRASPWIFPEAWEVLKSLPPLSKSNPVQP